MLHREPLELKPDKITGFRTKPIGVKLSKMRRLFLAFFIAVLAVAGIGVKAQANTRFLLVQNGSSDCGPATLATLLRFYLDVDATEGEISRLAGLKETSGTTLLGLEEAAKAKNCLADSFLMSFPVLQKQLESYPAPLLVRILLPEPHFVLVLAVKNDLVYLADPASGNLVLPAKVFLKRWLVTEPKQSSAEIQKSANEESKGFVFMVATPTLHTNSTHQAQIIRELDRQMENLDSLRWSRFSPRN